MSKCVFNRTVALLLILLLSMTNCKSKNVGTTPVSGPWLITIATSDIGQLQTIMYFEADNTGHNTCYAYSEKGTSGKILGFWKSTLARISGSFKGGSLLRIVKGKYTDDSVTGVLVTPFKNFHLHASVKNNEIDGVLKDGKYNVVGSFSGNKNIPELPLRDYTTLTQKLIATTKEKLYDPSIFKSSDWGKFQKKMTKISAEAMDDAEYIMAFFYYSKLHLPFSHYAVYRPEADIRKTKNDYDTKKNVELEKKTDKTMYMKVTSFSGSAEEMDESLEKIITDGYDTLIVDLRQNPGGSVEAGMAFVRHLIPDTLYAGIFLTQKYFKEEKQPPHVTRYKDFPHFSEANYDLIIEGISQHKGICIVGVPGEPVFKGKVYILTDNQTASTCEPIVYSLKQHKLATIVGEKTAGAMLNGEHFSLPDGFKVTVPTAAYYTSDGKVLDKKGVAPDVQVPSAQALDYVLNNHP